MGYWWLIGLISCHVWGWSRRGWCRRVKPDNHTQRPAEAAARWLEVKRLPRWISASVCIGAGKYWNLGYSGHFPTHCPDWLWVRSVLDAPEARRSSDCGAPEQGSDTGEVEEERSAGVSRLSSACVSGVVNTVWGVYYRNVSGGWFSFLGAEPTCSGTLGVLCWLAVSLVAFHCHSPLDC